MTDAAIYVVVWCDRGKSYPLDFDDAEMARDCALHLEAMGATDVLVSGPMTPARASERLDIAAVRVWEATVARLQERIAQQQLQLQDMSGRLLSVRLAKEGVSA